MNFFYIPKNAERKSYCIEVLVVSSFDFNAVWNFTDKNVFKIIQPQNL